MGYTNTNSKVQVYRGTYRTAGATPWTPYEYQFLDKSEMVSNSHPGYPENLGQGDVGGSWYLHKIEHDVRPAFFERLTGASIRGPIIATQQNGATINIGSPISIPDDQTLIGLGSTAISRCLPTNSAAELGTALGEFYRDGIPDIIGSGLLKERSRALLKGHGGAGSLAKGASHEYLNLEFGWKPMMSDLRDFCRAVKQSEKIISQYKAASDKKIRRRYAFSPTHTVRVSEGVFSPLPPASPYAGKCYTSEIIDTQTWFSGAFRYHVPVGDDVSNKLSRYASYADKLLGVRLTPDVVWNLAPWSWAADWFSNTGDCLHNISKLGKDGLVMEYGYVMSSAKKTYEFTYAPAPGGRGYYKRTEKFARRLKASPYGFDVTWDGLSIRQQAIVAALGITRSGGRAK